MQGPPVREDVCQPDTSACSSLLKLWTTQTLAMLAILFNQSGDIYSELWFILTLGRIFAWTFKHYIYRIFKLYIYRRFFFKHLLHRNLSGSEISFKASVQNFPSLENCSEHFSQKDILPTA